MASRAELTLRANAVNIDASAYENDSVLEQAIIHAEENLGTSTTATTIAATTADAGAVSGGANIGTDAVEAR